MLTGLDTMDVQNVIWVGDDQLVFTQLATAQDIYLLLGDLKSEACTSPTADGRPATPSFAAERLARVVCADTEMLSGDEIQAIAKHIAAEQICQIGIRPKNDR